MIPMRPEILKMSNEELLQTYHAVQASLPLASTKVPLEYANYCLQLVMLGQEVQIEMLRRELNELKEMVR